MALAMAYAREISLEQSIKTTLPVSKQKHKESPNWIAYRLPKSRMKNLRDVSTHWAYTCAYDTRGFSTTDYVLARLNETDPITFDSSVDQRCRKYEYFNINGDVCENCYISSYQRNNIVLHYGASSLSDSSDPCDGLQLTGSFDSCTRFFGNYECYTETFACTSSPKATTQLWFVTMHD